MGTGGKFSADGLFLEIRNNDSKLMPLSPDMEAPLLEVTSGPCHVGKGIPVRS